MSIADQKRVARAKKAMTWGALLFGVLVLPVLVPIEESMGLWMLFKARGAIDPPDDVVVIGIDENSRSALDGPLSRSMHARLVESLVRARASLIVFDVFLHTQTDDDALLARALQDAGNVVLTAALDRDSESGLDVQRLRVPVPALAEVSAGVAPWLVPETFRVNWVFMRDGSGRATIPLTALEHYVADGSADPSRPIDTSVSGAGGANRLYLNFYGPPRTIETIPYQDALAGGFAEGSLAGKAVFIGYSARRQPGQQDDYPYVFSTDGFNLSGVEMGATAFANLLHGDSLGLPPLPIRVLLVVLWGVLIAACFRRLRSRPGFIVAALATAGYLLFAMLAFGRSAVWLPIVVPAAQFLLAALFAQRVRQLEERAELSIGTSEEAALALTGRGKAEKTDHRVILFADEQGSKKRLRREIDSLDDSRRRALQRDIAIARDVPIAANGGSINHTLADSMLAYWLTARGDDEDFAAKANAACRAALAIHSRVATLDREYPGFGPALRIGLDWGEISSRLNPSPEIKDWKMEGMPIHCAERRESLNTALGTSTLISHALACALDRAVFHPRELGTFVFCDDRGEVVVDAVRVYELRAADGTDAATDSTFDQALAALRNLQWQVALNGFNEVAGAGGTCGALSSRYRSWCEKTLQEEQTRWRGIVVVTFSDKSQFLDRFI